MNGIRALSIDLDGTLWEIGGVIERAEALVQDVMRRHFPRAARRYDAEGLRRLRSHTAHANPHLAHDFTALRRLTFESVLAECGYARDDAHALMVVYLDARHDLEPYPDVVPALERLSARFPLTTLSNGNAEVHRVGLRRFFRGIVNARGVGALKPHPTMFAAACAALGTAPQEVLHVGDHPLEDVHGARDVGMKTAWVNRGRNPWQHGDEPDVTVASLSELADLLTERP